MTNPRFVKAMIAVGVQAAALSQAASAVASTYLSATVFVFGGAAWYPNLPEPWSSERYHLQPFSFTFGFHDENGDFIFNGDEIASNGMRPGVQTTIYPPHGIYDTKSLTMDFSSVLRDGHGQNILIGFSAFYEYGSLASHENYGYRSGSYNRTDGDFFDFYRVSEGRAAASVSINGAVVPLPAGLVLLPTALLALGAVGLRRRRIAQAGRDADGGSSPEAR